MPSQKTTLPYTGKEFLESLDDGREVWISIRDEHAPLTAHG